MPIDKIILSLAFWLGWSRVWYIIPNWTDNWYLLENAVFFWIVPGVVVTVLIIGKESQGVTNEKCNKEKSNDPGKSRKNLRHMRL
jgi:hypothetical protein